MEKFDFSGWATRHNVKCSDGRTIMRDAFKHNDGQTVPLVWNHQHSDPSNVIGHALLEYRDEGIYTYGSFNETPLGTLAREQVRHGDITALSIYANQLKERGGDVFHGAIREVSLVLAGANPEAFIDSVIMHSDDEEFEATIYSGEAIDLYHADKEDGDKKDASAEEDKKSESKSKEEKTLAERFNDLSADDQELVYAIVGQILTEEESEEEDKKDSEGDKDEDKKDAKEGDNETKNIKHSEGGNDTMKHNIFDQNQQESATLNHSAIAESAFADGKRFGSLKESFLQHAAINNITNVGDLLPKEKDLNIPPEWIKEDDSWVSKVMGAVHHTPFSRVRALYAKMDETEARARGYIKGNMKKDLALSVLKRTTAPTTVYIKMAMDRDDIVDIDFDVLAWIKSEMRGQLNRELALGFLLGDKRDLSSDDKIDELCIRPVLTDDDMYTIKYTVTDGTDHHNDFNSASENDSEAKGVVRAAVKSRKNYKGSGTPTFFTTEDLLTELLLIEDQNGRRIYESVGALATAMRVKEIVTVPEMEAHTDIYGIIVNFADYNTGTDRGGAVSMFDDFDINYNQQRYLMETRCSGALVKPYSAIVLKKASV